MYREPGCMRQGGRDLVPDVNYIGGQNYILCRPVKCPPSLPTRNAPTKFYFQRPPRASKSIINEELNLTRFWNRIPFRCDIIIYTSDVSLGNFTFASRVKRFPLYDTFRFVPFSLLSLIFSHREDECRNFHVHRDRGKIILAFYFLATILLFANGKIFTRLHRLLSSFLREIAWFIPFEATFHARVPTFWRTFSGSNLTNTALSSRSTRGWRVISAFLHGGTITRSIVLLNFNVGRREMAER